MRTKLGRRALAGERGGRAPRLPGQAAGRRGAELGACGPARGGGTLAAEGRPAAAEVEGVCTSETRRWHGPCCNPENYGKLLDRGVEEKDPCCKGPLGRTGLSF